MRSAFRGYYRPTDAELKDIWDDGLLVLDTNALLNLFRYSANAREDFFLALNAKKEGLWIPYQVGYEFHRRRIEIVNAQSKAFGEIRSALQKARGQVDQAFNLYKRHPSLDISPLRDEFGEAISALDNKLSEASDTHLDEMIGNATYDAILTQISDLYEGHVGAQFTPAELTAIYEEGAKRYEAKVPPGYEDIKKGEPDRYGDLVLWKELLRYGADTKAPAIFVTDDQKEDWWYTVDSQRHGARPELVDEYFVASGKRIHFMTSDLFLRFAKTKLDEIRTESVDEAERLSRDSAHSYARVATERTAREMEFQAALRRGAWRELVDDRRLGTARFKEERSRLLAVDPAYGAARENYARMQLLRERADEDLTTLIRSNASDLENPEVARRVRDAHQALRVSDAELESARAAVNNAIHDFDLGRFERNGIAHAQLSRLRRPESIGDIVDEALGMPPLDLGDYDRDHEAEAERNLERWILRNEFEERLREHEDGQDAADRSQDD